MTRDEQRETMAKVMADAFFRIGECGDYDLAMLAALDAIATDGYCVVWPDTQLTIAIAEAMMNEEGIFDQASAAMRAIIKGNLAETREEGKER